MNDAHGTLHLRPATLADAGILLAWRNDAATRLASHNGAVVTLDEHRAWLSASLVNPDRRIWLACRGPEPVGTVRADRTPAPPPGSFETTLSWTVSPDHRGGGTGRAIVALAVQAVTGPLHAEVRLGNTASARIAQSVGLQFDGEHQGVLHFRRKD
jgi:RimJ/RimL family protein N-acetyltransferase